MTQFQTAGSAAMDDARPILKPGWGALNIVLMIVGFIVFWPLGLAMLAYNIWGHKLGDFKKDMKRQFANIDGWTGESGKRSSKASSRIHPTGNVAFDEYRAQEFARLEEERQKIENMRREFDDYMENLRKARDKEEFDRFMASRASKNANSDDAAVINT